MKRSVRAAMLPVAAAAMLLCLSAGPAQKPKVQKVNIKHLEFDPAKVTVKVGQTVQWSNADDHDHTVVAKNKSFASENLGHDDVFRHTFAKAGKYEYFCRYHPRMKGTVLVEQ
jgi:plastocyanin